MNLVRYFFHNFMGKTSKNSFLYCRVCTKNLISIKLRKLIILASKCTFFWHKQPKPEHQSNVYLLGIYNFVSSMHDAVVKYNQQMIFRVIAGMFKTEILSTQVCHTDKLFSSCLLQNCEQKIAKKCCNFTLPKCLGYVWKSKI